MQPSAELTSQVFPKAVKISNTKGHVEVVKKISNVVANNSQPPDKIRENASFSFYQKIAQNMGWSHFEAILI